MCGRYAFIPTDIFFRHYNLKERNMPNRYNIAPGQNNQVLLKKDNNNELHIMRWGLTPNWSTSSQKDYHMINTRIESFDEKPYFKGLLKHKRCLIPASGFFEWTKIQDKKMPFYIHIKDRPFFTFAGVYDIYKDADGSQIHSYSIITTDSIGIINDIHDRMPLILTSENEDRWLNSKITIDPISIFNVDAYSDINCYKVSRDVNYTENDYPELINKLVEPHQESLFNL